MANVLHSALTGTELHEPKGADNATAGQVFSADGGGSGSFTHDFQKQAICTHIPPIEGLGTITPTNADESTYIYIPYDCTVATIHCYATGLVTGTQVSASTITTYNNAGTALTGGSTTAIAGVNSHGATLSPSANNTFTAGQTLRVRRTIGGNTTASLAWNVTVILTRTG